MTPPRRRSPSRPAFRAVVLPGLLLSALVGFVALLLQGYFVVLQERENARSLFVGFGESVVPAMERALWDINEPQVEVLLDGIAQTGGVAWVELVDERNARRSRGTAPVGDVMEHRFPLAMPGAGLVPLGELRVALASDLGQKRAFERVVTGTIALLGTLAFAIAILVHLMKRHLLEPLDRLCAGVARYSPDQDVSPSGRTAGAPPLEVEEVWVLAEALDLMHLRIRHDTDEIATLANDLESKDGQMEAVVQQRTAELEEKNRALATQAATLESLANTDALTGAASRRALFELGDRERARALRDRRPMALLALDIDHFKSINDTLGHSGGDVVLKTVVGRALAQLRGNDVMGRIGGEEFAILLPGADAEAARMAAERIRTRIAGTPIAAGSQSITVTASIGIAVFEADRSLDALLAEADEALYRAKRDGRNRVVVSNGATGSG